MRKKILSLVLSMTIVLTLAAPTFAAESNLSKLLNEGQQRSKQAASRVLNDRDLEVVYKTGTLKLGYTKRETVNSDLCIGMYDLNLTSSKSINLNYKYNAELFEIAIISEDADIIWYDQVKGTPGTEKSKTIDVKLPKGEYLVMVSSTKGAYSVKASTSKTTLKTMSPFTIKHVLPGATSVSGTGVAGAKVTVMTEDTKIYTTTVKSDNTYRVTVPKQEEDSILIVTIQKSGYGAKVKEAYVEKYYFSTFTINTVKTTSTTVTGKGKSGATVRAYVGSKEIGKSTVKSDGTYSISIPKQQSGKTITVKMSKTNYYTEYEETKVKKVFSKSLVVNSVKSTSTSVTGKGQSTATVTAYVGSKKIGSSTVKSDGTYSIKIPKQSKGKTIKVSMSKSGYATTSKTITVK